MATDEQQQAMASERLAEIRAQLQRIARAPWSVTPHADAMHVWADDGDRVAVVEGMQATADPARFANERDNAQFIAAAPTIIGDLLAKVEQLGAKLAAKETREAAHEPLSDADKLATLREMLSRETRRREAAEAREAALVAALRAVAAFDANHDSVGAFWRMQEQARALLASAAEAENGEQTAQQDEE